MSLSPSLQPLLDRLQTIFSPKTNNLLIRVIPITLITATSIPLISKCYADYQAWLAMGPGGVPYNAFGWAIQSVLRLVTSHDLFSTEVYTDSKIIKQYGENAEKSFIKGGLEKREGEKARVVGFVAPQRQDGGGSDEKIKDLERQLIHKIASDNPNLVTLKNSFLEKLGPALWLNESLPVPSWVKVTKGEIAHIHVDADGTSHVILSLADAKEVIEKGWGCRHRLSGRRIPIGYLMIWAPRNEKEVEILGRILKAGVGFVTGVEKEAVV